MVIRLHKGHFTQLIHNLTCERNTAAKKCLLGGDPNVGIEFKINWSYGWEATFKISKARPQKEPVIAVHVFAVKVIEPVTFGYRTISAQTFPYEEVSSRRHFFISPQQTESLSPLYQRAQVRLLWSCHTRKWKPNEQPINNPSAPRIEDSVEYSCRHNEYSPHDKQTAAQMMLISRHRNHN